MTDNNNCTSPPNSTLAPRFETSWVLEARDDGGSWAEVEEGPPEGRRYAPNNRYVGLYCLEPGEYRFTIYDLFQDGMCCSFGEGSYSGFVDGSQQFADDGSKWAKRIHRFAIAAPSSVPQPKSAVVAESEEAPSMTARDSEWLDSHNVRRKEWHERYNTTYVPLEWSNSLKESSQVWADHLLDSCGQGMFHDPDTQYGENVAGNSGSGSWGEVKPTEKILYRFVEREANWEYPKNSHLTQVLWRATKYVGCAEASKPKEGGGMCHTQVCRYARPGNCNMGKHRGDGEWWLEPMLMDDSPCGPSCPSDRC